MKPIGRVGIVAAIVLSLELVAAFSCYWWMRPDSLQKAGSAYEAGQYAEAIQECTLAIESGKLSQTQLANAYHDRGWAYWKKGDHDKAIADFTKAIELDPKFVPAYDIRGGLYRRKGEDAKADADYRKARELRRDRP